MPASEKRNDHAYGGLVQDPSLLVDGVPLLSEKSTSALVDRIRRRS